LPFDPGADVGAAALQPLEMLEQLGRFDGQRRRQVRDGRGGLRQLVRLARVDRYRWPAPYRTSTVAI
jgi:hypothetical protein